ncbi:MAG: acyl-CoA reductase [Chthoniobacterales bacterium]
MKTEERAQAIALAAAPMSDFLGRTQPETLLRWVEAELGDAGAHDRWVKYGAARTKAVAPDNILHVVSGNTPHAALQSLISGLILGSSNLVKLPRGGIPEVDDFISRLPADLAAKITMGEELRDDWIGRATAVVVYGSDETIAALRAKVPSGKIFIGHGHKASAGIVWKDENYVSCAGAARDTSLFDQQGCLSPRVFYVRETKPGFARAYAEQLAEEMERYGRIHPHGPLSVAEKVEISDLRAAYNFRAAGDLRVAIWAGGPELDWTVVYEEDPWFPSSALSRVIFVKPLPADLVAELGPHSAHLGAIGLWPCTEELADRFFALGASRFCPIGRMQDPPWTWHNGGVARLAPLVKWVDFEG